MQQCTCVPLRTGLVREPEWLYICTRPISARFEITTLPACMIGFRACGRWCIAGGGGIEMKEVEATRPACAAKSIAMDFACVLER